MSVHEASTYTAFEGVTCLARGARTDVALAVRTALAARPDAAVLVFDDATGGVVDLDLRGSDEEVVRRIGGAAADAEPRGRGRPKLGVVAREVTLLPRHWDWLAGQPGGASQALRRLVDRARRETEGATAARASRDAAYRFMSAMAGDLPGFEEAARVLFAGDRDRLEACMSAWPADVRAHAERLAYGEAPGVS
jgi:hypothetical protein